MSAVHSAVAANGRSAYGAAFWTTKDQRSAYPDHRVHSCADPFPYPGDYAGRRDLLRAECGQQKYDRCGPEETAEWQQFSLRSQWIRKKFFCQRRDCCISTCHGG